MFSLFKKLEITRGLIFSATFFSSICFMYSCSPETKNNPEICFDVTKQYETGKGFIYKTSGDSLLPIEVSYLVVNGQKIFQGDIMLKTVNENYGILKRDDSLLSIRSISTYGDLWPNGLIFYIIDPALTAAQKADINSAMNYWTSKTGLIFAQRNQEPNWVYFIPSPDGPASMGVGMIGGEQKVKISSTTTLGNIKHEIGHVVGLWHEQSRSDRDTYVTIEWSNILAGKESQFDKQAGNLNPDYDYNSIMHYSKNAFAKNPSKPTITALNPAPKMGQRDSLTILDIAGVKKIYP